MPLHHAALTLLTLLPLLGLGCNGTPLTPEAVSMLRTGVAAYESGDNETTIERMSLFLGRYAGSRRDDEAYYYRGMARYNLQQRDLAKVDFNRALDTARRDDLRGRALIALGDLAYDGQDMSEAEMMFRQALKELDRKTPPTDHALYRLATALQRLGRWDEADRHFTRLTGDFPDSPLARRAGRMVFAVNWTVQVGVFAEKHRADALSQQLQEQGFPAFVWERLVDGKLRHFVQVGRYGSYDQSRSMLAKVRRVHPKAVPAVTR